MDSGIIIGIVGVLLTMVSSIWAIRSEKKRIKEKQSRQQLFTWEHIYNGTLQLIKWLRKSQFIPKITIGPPGATNIIAGILQLELKEKPDLISTVEYSLDTKISDKENKLNYQYVSSKWKYLVPKTILNHKDEKVLIIVVYTHFGSTIQGLKQLLISKGFQEENIKIASIISVKGIEGTVNEPDWTWIWMDTYELLFPWGHVSRKLRESPANS
ncbi:hypothetical protein [Reichenbachiella sp.]|uniref:hypothetical protein n=1 Tax=Reichenbachiella sp. TaxID=2184521 RepID=UPI003BB141D9